MSFGERLLAQLSRRGRLCVGVDPHAAILREWGLADSVTGLRAFADVCAEAFGPVASVVKPQSAFFERFGSAGIAVLESLVGRLRAAGALVLLDVKRGDIGSTMQAYAEAYLDPAAPLACDAITVSPFLGVGALGPAFDLAAKHDAGVFVLALTSNEEGAQVQQAAGASGATVAQEIVDDLAARNRGAVPLGSLGVVVGATLGSLAADLSQLNGPVLVPGLGAQGGTPADVRRLFAGMPGVLPSSSRGVLRAGPSVDALRSAVAVLSAELDG